MDPRISVIDDDASLRRAIGSLLRSRGYAVSTFASAVEFRRSLELDETSCVIFDVRMPHISGVELQTVFRKRARRVPFIVITELLEYSALRQALRDGPVCFLSKPFDAPALIKCVETAIEARVAVR